MVHWREIYKLRRGFRVKHWWTLMHKYSNKLITIIWFQKTKDNFFQESIFFHEPISFPEQLLSSQEDESKELGSLKKLLNWKKIGFRDRERRFISFWLSKVVIKVNVTNFNISSQAKIILKHAKFPYEPDIANKTDSLH